MTELAWNKVYCIDAIEGIKKIKKVDVIFSSVPFKDTDVEGDYWTLLDEFLKIAKLKTEKYIILLQSSTRIYDMCVRYGEPARILMWIKPIMCQSYKYTPIFCYHGLNPPFHLKKVNGLWSDVFPFLPVINGSKYHPYQDPVELYTAVLKSFLQKIDKFTVLDPFMGSGTTAKACMNLGLTYMGFDINPLHVKHANKIKIHTLDDYGTEEGMHEHKS